MHTFEPFLAQSSGLDGAFGTLAIGFLFVIAVLALLAAATAAMGAFFTRQAAQESRKAAEASQKAAEATAKKPQEMTPERQLAPAGEGGQPVASASAESEDPLLLPVIAAAVHTVLGDRPHRIVSVRSISPGWAQEGRRAIFSSHRVR